jgi:hypothetical protein
MNDMMNLKLPEELEWDFTINNQAEIDELTKCSWPNYLIDESDIEDPRPASNLPKEELKRRFLLWGIRAKQDKRLLAFASAVLIFVDHTKAILPNNGWNYASEAYGDNSEPNSLCLLSANIRPEARNLKLSYHLINQSKLISKNNQMHWVIAPVRPSQKDKYPLEQLDIYLNRKTENGDMYDPWVRAHINLGAEILNICSESVIVKASPKKWHEWTGIAFEKSGDYILSKGLVPMKMDLEKNVGSYIEPNVWVRYRL